MEVGAPADTLLIRGGTSTVGLAALQLAKAIGAKVVSMSRSERKAHTLAEQHGQIGKIVVTIPRG